MFAKVNGMCILGLEGQLVEVEVDLSNGLPAFHIVGLPDSSIKESMERVRAAIRNCGFDFPMKRITVNLAPADVRKEGTAFDLSIAAGILAAGGQIRSSQWQNTVLLGELALDGTLRGVAGVLPMVHRAKKLGFHKVIVPTENSDEARLISGIALIPIRHLSELKQENGNLDALLQKRAADPRLSQLSAQTADHPADVSAPQPAEDFAEVRGQFHAKRALMIAASGMHNILFIGPPGTGKTMLMRRLPTIMPELDDEEALEVTQIYSAAGKLPSISQLIRSRPFRSPHHTITAVGLTGGGAVPKPGEISLAHHGVLYLDELPEYKRSTLEALRQPMEDKKLTISRTKGVFTFPCDFLLAASMNPCPCGHLGDMQSRTPCTCHPVQIQKYRAKISGPLADRIDLHVEVPKVPFNELIQQRPAPDSRQIKQQVVAAQRRQKARYKQLPIRWNCQLTGSELERYCELDRDALVLLRESYQALGLSARAHARILRVSRTIADLEGCDGIQTRHVAEAISYRVLDRGIPVG